MHPYQVLQALAVLWTLCNSVAAVAPELEAMRKTHRVNQAPHGRKRNVLHSVHNTYRKYGVDSASLPKGPGVAHVTATDVENQDAEYLSPVKIGSTVVQLVFDTGSSNLWVDSTQLPPSEQGSHHLYPLSGTQKPGESWSVQYADASASGNVWADSVAVGALTATSQAVQAATSISSGFVTDPADGIFGLAFDSLNQCTPTKCTTFLTRILSKLKAKLFTATLRHKAAGEYDFGFIDPAKYTGTIAYVSVASSGGYWNIPISGYQIGHGAKKTLAARAAVDTSTPFLYLPSSVCQAYYSVVANAQNSSGLYVFPCSDAPALPAFSLVFAGAKRQMPGSYVNAGPDGTAEGSCLGAIQSSAGFPFSIIGEAFLKSQFVVFDRGNSRVGFAQQKH